MSAQSDPASADWIEVLRDACRHATQGAVARRIGYSSPVVNQVLSGSYKGDLNRVQAAVEGALMAALVDCPVIGEIPRQRCIEHQRRPFTPTNPTNIQLYKTCPVCEHSLRTARKGDK